MVRMMGETAQQVVQQSLRPEYCMFLQQGTNLTIYCLTLTPFFSAIYPVGQHGRGKLAITRPSALLLLDSLNVFPHIYRYMSAFGDRLYATDESFSGVDFQVEPPSKGAMPKLGEFSTTRLYW